VRPFAEDVETGAYWLTRLKTRKPSEAMRAFRDWLIAASV
jgi:LysR family transcriptional regulator of beta-lactamase